MDKGLLGPLPAPRPHSEGRGEAQTGAGEDFWIQSVENHLGWSLDDALGTHVETARSSVLPFPPPRKGIFISPRTHSKQRPIFPSLNEASTEGMLCVRPGLVPLKSNPLKMTLLPEKGRRWRECESLRAGGVSSLLPRAC